jgi:hypothetical protein
MDDHLSGCEQCRSGLSASSALADWAAQLHDTDSGDHLTYAQLVARMEHRIADSDRFAIEAHLKNCSACREEVADLTRFRGRLQGDANRRRWLIPAAVAAAAIVVLGIWSRPGTWFQPGIWFKQRSAPAVAHFEIPASWASEDRALIARTLAAGELPFAAVPQELAAKPSTLLGPSVPAAYQPLSPMGAIVYSDRPQFRWSALAGAKSYRVEVYTADFQQAARSGSIQSTEWTPSEALPRGVTLRWQIVAAKGTQTITAPAPPAPEARFQIADRATVDGVEHARSLPDGRLLAAALLAKAGLHDDAVTELSAIGPELLKFPEIQNLLSRPH